VKASSLDRESDFSLQCFAGPEISVASTKGFTTQLTVLLMLSLHMAFEMGKFSKAQLLENLKLVTEIPGRIAESLNKAENIKLIAKEVALAKNVMFIGRNYIYPVALEGALKLKELSYIHAEAIAAGELKHGPIALIDENVPIIVLAPENDLFEKTSSNAQEVAARGGKLITLSSAEGNEVLKNISSHQLNISASHSLIEPIIYAIPMQLLAYYVAVIKGTDVDQPRNLAKSVTVE
jgi:glucosamine--fructose-6-phosphate aminotransferase (isomerizing)